NNKIYAAAVTPVVTNAVGLTLNGDTYTSGTPIATCGKHTLVITGVGGYTQTIGFTVLPTVINVTDGGVYAVAVNPVINNAVGLALNGEAHTSGTQISRVGNHEILITGVGGYTRSVSFTVTESSNIAADAKYMDSVAVNVPNAVDLKVDGETVANGTLVDLIGEHTLTVIGIGSYERKYEFTVTPTLTVSEGQVFGKPVKILLIKATMLLDGEEINADTDVSKHGRHTLVIKGTGDYTETITFKYSNPNLSLTLFISIPVAIAAAAAAAIVFLKRRRVL
ncbi:MAG: hypothetical protein LBL66_09535, partial [Clostridiales bacterium]|nr:hypothetical protein [Clostridiales bacterium]